MNSSSQSVPTQPVAWSAFQPSDQGAMPLALISSVMP